jgi:hypothetical protein
MVDEIIKKADCTFGQVRPVKSKSQFLDILFLAPQAIARQALQN